MCIHFAYRQKKCTRKQKYMKTNRKQIKGFLLILLVAQIINLGIFKGLEIGSGKLGKYIYSQTAQPFLEQTR